MQNTALAMRVSDNMACRDSHCLIVRDPLSPLVSSLARGLVAPSPPTLPASDRRTGFARRLSLLWTVCER
ncbi:hypothetical protein C8Q74DRAFT_1249261 [Fomes fomentarius]|nr:hypothetical protein C8Q74DRAFT_1249261 [Fomes fomentarius]